jgi:hypothetical protein
MRFLSFDIEISDVFKLAPGEDLQAHAPFHISVAATVESGGEKRLWYSKDETGKPKTSMEEADVRELLAYLEKMQDEGVRIFAWNGLHFDLQWIGYNAGQMERAAKVALRLYDPMFQFFNRRGFPVGLAAVGEGLGLRQTKLMDSADAPVEWRAGKFERVMEYVAGDCEMTNQIVEAIGKQKAVRWRTKRGSMSSEAFPQFKTVAEVLREPEPDQSWMTTPGLRRRDFIDWIPVELLG